MSNDNEPAASSARIDGWTAARRDKFLEVLSETANVAHAARTVQKSVSGVYQLRRRDSAFAAAWDEALEVALDQIEAAVLDRVVNGVEKDVFYGGKHCGTTRLFSDALAMFILKARRPDVYGRVATIADEPQGEDADRSRGELQRRLRLLGDRLKAA